MKVRAYAPADLEALKRMHAAQALPYELPDVADPLFAVRAVAENGDGRAAMAILLRVVGEAYLLFDPHEQTEPRRRWRSFLALHEAARVAALDRGLEEVFCWLPPEVPSSFEKHLKKLHWWPAPWRCYGRKLEA